MNIRQDQIQCVHASFYMDLLASDTALPELCGEQPQRPVMLPGEFIPVPRKDISLRANTDVVPNMLCSKCKPIRVWLQHDQDVKKQALPQIFNHYDTGAGLEQGYLKGCHLCTLFWRSIMEDAEDMFDRHERERGLEHAREERHIKVAIHRLDISPKPSDDPLFLKISSDLSGDILHGKRLSLDLWQDDRRSLIGANLEPSVSSSVALSAAPMSITTSCSFVLRLIARWLELCVTRHQNCKPAVTFASALPKRLLDLSEADRSNQLKVVSTDDSFLGAKYAAISYCWGNSSGYPLLGH